MLLAPPHAPHPSSKSLLLHRPSALWCRASQSSATATARSVSSPPPIRSTSDRRTSSARWRYGSSGGAVSVGSAIATPAPSAGRSSPLTPRGVVTAEDEAGAAGAGASRRPVLGPVS